jgi:uncharacterized protein with PIN domain
MSIPVHFWFAGSLNDFLRKEFRGRSFVHSCPATSTVKDGFEATGVPHAEVAALRINGHFSGFGQPLLPEDRVEVFPRQEYPLVPPEYSLHPPLPANPAFVLDVHLGKLARLLRLTGFDCLYETNYADARIAAIAAEQGRIVLTRDVFLLKRNQIKWGYWLRSQNSEVQLREVLVYFGLYYRLRPFSRCTVCNGDLHPVDKNDISHRLEPQTKAGFDQFFRCESCGRIYWRGSHYERMQQMIRKLKEEMGK